MRYQPSELRDFLSELGAFPKKRLSQNFLIDGNIGRKIVALAGVKKNEPVLEIGPGPGALTELLLESMANVTAVEMDPLFADHLKKLGKIEVICADFLQLDLVQILQKKTKVVANLPYRITTPILSSLLPLHSLIDTVTVMVQKEVAERFLAKPGSKEWNSFSLFIHFYADISYGFTVKKTCFYPIPKVDSAVVQFKLKQHPQVKSVERFFTLTRHAFQHRRKMLKASLKPLYKSEEVERVLENLGLRKDIRPEGLSLTDFLRFFEIIDQE